MAEGVVGIGTIPIGMVACGMHIAFGAGVGGRRGSPRTLRPVVMGLLTTAGLAVVVDAAVVLVVRAAVSCDVTCPVAVVAPYLVSSAPRACRRAPATSMSLRHRNKLAMG